MALAVFFLLAGTLGAEMALFGIAPAGLAGAASLALSAITLAHTWLAVRAETAATAPANAATSAGRAVGAAGRWQPSRP
jgi:hypothetical protein